LEVEIKESKRDNFLWDDRKALKVADDSDEICLHAASSENARE